MTTTKILIIEDDLPLRMSLARALQSGGYETAGAGDAIAAISTAVHERPDLVLLDLGLPGGNGTVVLERLRNLPATLATPVIVLTGAHIEQFRRDALDELGCDAILVKPIAPPELLAAVREVLGASHTPAAQLGQG